MFVVCANSILASLNGRSSLSKRPQVFQCAPASELLPIRDPNASRDYLSPDDVVSTKSLNHIWCRCDVDTAADWRSITFICATGRKAKNWLVSSSSDGDSRGSQSRLRVFEFDRWNAYKECGESINITNANFQYNHPSWTNANRVVCRWAESPTFLNRTHTFWLRTRSWLGEPGDVLAVLNEVHAQRGNIIISNCEQKMLSDASADSGRWTDRPEVRAQCRFRRSKTCRHSHRCRSPHEYLQVWSFARAIEILRSNLRAWNWYILREQRILGYFTKVMREGLTSAEYHKNREEDEIVWHRRILRYDEYDDVHSYPDDILWPGPRAM